MRVYPVLILFKKGWLHMILVLSCFCPTDSLIVDTLLEAYVLFRFRWILIDEGVHDCFFND